MTDRFPERPTLPVDLEGSPHERSAAARDYLANVREMMAQRYAEGEAGRSLCAAYAEAVDDLVRALFESAHRRHGEALAGPVALAGTGGYGRAELCPYSDVDLLFLYPRPPDRALEALTQEVLYPLWDARLDVGHAVREVREAVGLARQDLTLCTALLDARPVGGAAELVERLRRETFRALFTPNANRFIRQLQEEVRQRRERFGETPYLLEPNLKNGDGALRDLNVGLWAAKARFRIADFADLVRQGHASRRQVAVLVDARELLLHLRTALHLIARRRQDRLTFEAQEEIARRLAARDGSSRRRPPPAPAVEELMRRVYLATKAIRHEVARLLERLVVPPRRAPSLRRVDASFNLFNGRLSTEPGVLRAQPGEMVRLFKVALENGCEIYGHTRDLIAELLSEPDEGPDGAPSPRRRLAEDPGAARCFIDLLCDPRDRLAPSLLEQMHDLGVLAALMPEFGALTCRTQHDLYHVYTVDQHSLYAVACLKALARSDPPYGKTHPVAVAAMRRLGAEARPALFLGTLLHDVGKPLGKGHADKGARLAAVVARRLGLAEGEVEKVSLLVRDHLLLPHLSQRRDITDAALVNRLARRVRDLDTLRQLYLVSFADMAMVAPGNLTEWKATLLRDLYRQTRRFLLSGPEQAGAKTQARIQERRRSVARLLGERLGVGALGDFIASLPDRYFVHHQAREIVRHVRLSRQRAASQASVALDLRHHRARGYSTVTVCAENAPGLLASIAGVLVSHRVHVHTASINSRRTAVGGEALDVFTVYAGGSQPIGDADRWRQVEADLAGVLDGQVEIRGLMAARTERSLLPPKVKPEVLTEIEIDNEVSRDFTVVDVYTHDRLGVLYTIAHTMAEQGLDIHLAKVGTEGDRVADAFYVRDSRQGTKLLGEERQVELQEALREALARLDG